MESTTAESSSTAVESTAEASAEMKSAEGTHLVIDHAGNEVEVPDKIDRIVIDQIPILSTYMSYFGGEAPYIVGYCGSFKETITDTALRNIAPELLESSETVYAQSDLNIEEIVKLDPDVIFYNANNQAHAEILKSSGIPAIGFATVNADTSAEPLLCYQQWLHLLEDVFGEKGKMDDFLKAGESITTDVEGRIAKIPEEERPSAMILFKLTNGVPQIRTIEVSLLNLLSKPFNTKERLAERGILRSEGLQFSYKVEGKRVGIIGYGLYNDFFSGRRQSSMSLIFARQKTC